MNLPEIVEAHAGTNAHDLAKLVVIDYPDVAIAIVEEEVQHVWSRARVEREHVSLARLVRRRPGVVRPVRHEAKSAFIVKEVRHRDPMLDALVPIDGKGLRVARGQMREEHYEMRKAMLAGLVGGLRKDIRMENAYLKRIKAAKATCLDDISEQFDVVEAVEVMA